jgi:imidazoleglycerol phosphate dehydratase HisB
MYRRMSSLDERKAERNHVHLVAKKNGNYQNKIDTFLQFLHSVRSSYKRYVRINIKIQAHLKKIFDRYCQLEN